MFFKLMIFSSTIISYYAIGKMDVNGEWSELMGGIVKEEVDIGMDKIVITEEKTNYVHFTQDIFSFT